MVRCACVALVGLFMAGCWRGAPVNNCAGFTPPPMPRKPAELVRNEPEVSRWVVGTNEIGKKMRCWK